MRLLAKIYFKFAMAEIKLRLGRSWGSGGYHTGKGETGSLD